MGHAWSVHACAGFTSPCSRTTWVDSCARARACERGGGGTGARALCLQPPETGALALLPPGGPGEREATAGQQINSKHRPGAQSLRAQRKNRREQRIDEGKVLFYETRARVLWDAQRVREHVGLARSAIRLGPHGLDSLNRIIHQQLRPKQRPRIAGRNLRVTAREGGQRAALGREVRGHGGGQHAIEEVREVSHGEGRPLRRWVGTGEHVPGSDTPQSARARVSGRRSRGCLAARMCCDPGSRATRGPLGATPGRPRGRQRTSARLARATSAASAAAARCAPA